MKTTFAKTWNASVQPRKQRKFRHNAPLHIAGKFMSVHLSKDLRTKHQRRSLRARKGDTIKILRGEHRGRTGKIERVSIKQGHVFVTGIDLTRRDGTKNLIPLQPSNLVLITIDTSDKKRLQRIGEPASPQAKQSAKPSTQ